KFRTKKLKFSYSRRCASDASVSNTSEDLPDPDTPVKMVIWRFGSWSDTSFKLFSRAPRTSIYSCAILSPSVRILDLTPKARIGFNLLARDLNLQSLLFVPATRQAR